MGQSIIIKTMLNNGNGWFRTGDLRRLIHDPHNNIPRSLSKLKFNGAALYDPKRMMYKLNMDDYDVKQVLALLCSTSESP